MLNNGKSVVDSCQGNTADIGILEQSFSQLPTEGKAQLKDYLHNLVSMQKTMERADNADAADLPAKDK